MWSAKQEAKTVEVESLTKNHGVLWCVLHRNRRPCEKLTGKGRNRYCSLDAASFPLLP
jgi:hypothetical protein